MSLVEQFGRDGWCVVRGIVEPGEIAALNDIFGAVVPEDGAWPVGPDGVVGEVTGASRAYEPLARIACDARLGALAGELLDASGVQLLQDSLLFKPARDGGSVHWHQDYTYLGFLQPANIVTMRIALTSESEESGAMYVVNGSHRWGRVGEIQALTETRVDSLLPSLTKDQRAAVDCAVPVALEPGDVSIHHCLTLHGSGPNRSEHARRTIILRMFDSRCRLDRARLSSAALAHFPLASNGALAASAFPVVFGQANENEAKASTDETVRHE